MSFNYRFEPPSAAELEEMSYSECSFNHNCDQCEYDCEDDFTIKDVNGLTLVNPREIGIKVANEHFDDPKIYRSDLLNDIQKELDNIVYDALIVCRETLEENNREIHIIKE